MLLQCLFMNNIKFNTFLKTLWQTDDELISNEMMVFYLFTILKK